MKDKETFPIAKKEASDSGLFGRGSYKFWALAAMLLLAFWSMFTGTVSLRWSGTLTTFSHASLHDHLDVLVSLHTFWVMSLTYILLFVRITGWREIFKLFRKSRSGRSWWGTCGTCTRITVGSGCRGSGKRPSRLPTRIWPATPPMLETLPSPRSLTCLCAPWISNCLLFVTSPPC